MYLLKRGEFSWSQIFFFSSSGWETRGKPYYCIRFFWKKKQQTDNGKDGSSQKSLRYFTKQIESNF